MMGKGSLAFNDSSHFFDINNTKALRGLFSLVIILVHIPPRYQNTVQDMIGSFAYIGVTFFFMTSAFGLEKSMSRTAGRLEHFWRHRLIKLLVPCFLVNILWMCKQFFESHEIYFPKLFEINPWTKWLLVCYAFYYCIKRIKCSGKYANVLICISVILFSVGIYCLKVQGVINNTTWCTEIYGFIWGLLLAGNDSFFMNTKGKKWWTMAIFSFLSAGILGILYLKMKCVFLLGDYVLKIVLGFGILFWMLIVNVKIKFANKVGCFLGSISYEIYLIHGFVIQCLLGYNCGSWVFILIVMLSTIAISFIMNRLAVVIMKNLMKLIKR